MELKIEEITIGNRFQKTLGNLDSLAKSIDKLGLLSPVGITPDHKLLCGRRRVEACRKLGWRSIPCHVLDGLSDVYRHMLAERDENTCRKDFTPSEAVAIAESLLAMEEQEAAKRHSAARRP